MYYIGVDLGGTNVAIGIVTEEGKITAKKSFKTAAERPFEEIIKDMANCIKLLLEENSISLEDVKSIGIGSPGNINSDSGTLVYANNFAYGKNIPLREMMQRYIDSNSFVSDMSVMIVSCLVIGGTATLRGPVLGAILLVTVPEVFRSLQAYRFVFYGAILIVMMLVRPAGLLGWDSTLPYKLPKGTTEYKEQLEKEHERKEQAVDKQ